MCPSPVPMDDKNAAMFVGAVKRLLELDINELKAEK